VKKLTEYDAFAAASPANRRLLKQEKLILGVTETLLKALIAKGLTKTELGKRLGHTKAYISQLFSGERNLTLRTISDLAEGIGCEAVFQLKENLESSSCRTDLFQWAPSQRPRSTFYELLRNRGAAMPGSAAAATSTSVLPAA